MSVIEATSNERITYLGWYDPDPKKPVRHKLADGIARYIDKFGQTPDQCLCHPVDSDALQPHATIPLTIGGRSNVARHTFYIGRTHERGDGVVAEPDGDV